MMKTVMRINWIMTLVLCMGAITAQAELQFVENFDTRPIGNLIGATPTAGNNGTVGVSNGTSSGNIQVQLQSGSNVCNIAGNSAGDRRGAGVYNMTDPIEVGEKGVVFFRFYVDNTRSVDHYIGIHARTTNINDSAIGSNPQNYIMAGFHLWSDGEPAGTMKMVSTNHTATFATGLLRAQWYNFWIEADHAAETFNVYVSTATGPAGAATLPNAEDKVVSDRPFEVATTSALAGMFVMGRTYASETAPWQRSNIQLGNARFDEVYWDGSNGLSSRIAQSPDPASNAVGVEVDYIFSWEAPDDPAISEVLFYDVYMDPNETKVATADPAALKSAEQMETSYTPASSLLFDTTYYWRVDTTATLVDDPNDPKTPVLYEGSVWSFTTRTPAPEIVASPADVLVAPSGMASFTVVADSPYALETFQWYSSADRANNTPADDVLISGAVTDTYIIPSAAKADEKYYYCKVSNVFNAVPYSVSSAAAALGVKRNVAYWTLDALVGGQYEDVSGEGHHADPNGTPVFVDGANPALTNNGVVVDADGGWANAGTWDPSEFSGQLTLSLWVKWAGQRTPFGYQGLLGKRTVYASDMRWQLEIGNNAASILTFKSNIGSGVTSPILPVDEWEQVVVTYDGTTATIYRNGTYVNSGPVTLSYGPTANLMLGAVGLEPALIEATSIFNGVLDDIKIYNYALDAVTVAYSFTDIDALGRKACADPRDPVLVKFDVDGDCEVGLGDLTVLAEYWLTGQLVPDVIDRP